MKLLIDMNLSPDWVAVLQKNGWETVHWAKVGDPRAADSTIMEWALANKRVIVTHDLDFGSVLAATQGKGPSVFQIRARDVLPDKLETMVVSALHAHESTLESGSLISLDIYQSRVRVLPLRQ